VKYKVKSQLYADAEAQLKGSKQVLDDCTWSSCAAAVSWASGYAVDFTAAQGVAAFEKATGRKDKQGVSDAGGSLAEAVKTVAALGGKARYAKSWDDAIAAAKQGAALLVWVQQPVGYPAGLRISAWHDRWVKWWAKKDPAHLKAGYGHMTSAGWDEVDGWQWACPTRDEKLVAEKFAVSVSLEQLVHIADSKRKAGKLAVSYKALLIVTHPARKATISQPRARVAAVQPPAAVNPERGVQPPAASTKNTAQPSAVDVEVAALRNLDWAAIGGRAISAASAAVAVAGAAKGTSAKVIAFLKYIKDNTGIDEAVLEFMRTFVTVSISVALGLGIPLLDINGGDFRTILSAGLASGLQVLVKFLDPQHTAFGIKAKD
jgi:hypothetical protein